MFPSTARISDIVSHISCLMNNDSKVHFESARSTSSARDVHVETRRRSDIFGSRTRGLACVDLRTCARTCASTQVLRYTTQEASTGESEAELVLVSDIVVVGVVATLISEPQHEISLLSLQA